MACISCHRIVLARRFALLRCIARPQARAQPHHVASYTPLGPKKQAQVPVWLVRSSRSSTGPIRENLSYLVKMDIFAPSVGHHGRPVGFTQGPHLKFSIRLDPIDHKNTLRWPFWGAQILLDSSRRWDPDSAMPRDLSFWGLLFMEDVGVVFNRKAV